MKHLFVLLSLLLAGATARAQTPNPTPTTLFFDNFAAGKFDASRWGTEPGLNHLSRTQFGGKPTFGKDPDGTTYMRVPMNLYNPQNPGNEVIGTEVYSQTHWNLGAGLEYEARIRFPANTPRGWVGGYFAYGWSGTWPDTYEQSEIDYEFTTNLPTYSIWTNIWDDWNPIRQGPHQDLVVSASGTNYRDGAWHVFKMRWEPTQTTWWMDSKLLRTETKVLPGEAMGVRFNAWLADPNWTAASNPSLVPVSTPAQNNTIFYDVSAITVRALPQPTNAPPYGNGTGLGGTYYAGANFDRAVLTRVDPRLNFNWGTSSPDPAIPNTNYSVRWDGFVLPRYSETYTFSTLSDDGARVWVNGQQLINVWKDGGANAGSGTIALQAGVKVPIRIEFYQHIGGSSITLKWSSPSTPLQLVPQSQFFPVTGSPTPTPTPTPLPTVAVAITPPAVNAHIPNFAGVAGTFVSATRVDVEIKRLSDGAYWNGWVWVSSETAVPAQLVGTTWKVASPASNGAGLPTGSNLVDGAYTLEADAYDAQGNIAIATRATTIQKSASASSVSSASAPSSSAPSPSEPSS